MVKTGLTKFLEKRLLEHALTDSKYERSAPLHLALFLAQPTDEEMGTEIAQKSYVRIPIKFKKAILGIGFDNIEAVSFPVAAERWGTVVGVGITEGISGPLLFWGPLEEAREVRKGDQLCFPKEHLSIFFD